MPLFRKLRSIIHTLTGGMLFRSHYDPREERNDICYEAQEGDSYYTKGWYHKTEDDDLEGPYPTRDEALIELGMYVANLHMPNHEVSEEIRQGELNKAYILGQEAYCNFVWEHVPIPQCVPDSDDCEAQRIDPETRLTVSQAMQTAIDNAGQPSNNSD